MTKKLEAPLYFVTIYHPEAGTTALKRLYRDIRQAEEAGLAKVREILGEAFDSDEKIDLQVCRQWHPDGFEVDDGSGVPWTVIVGTAEEAEVV